MLLIDECVGTKSERLALVREAYKLIPKQFADLLGEHASNYYQIESGGRPLGKLKSNDLLLKINNLSNEIREDRIVNPDWWETGEGEMFIYDKESDVLKGKGAFQASPEVVPVDLIDETEVTYNSKGIEFRELENGMVLMTITLVPEFAYASYPHGWRDPEYLVELPKYSIVLPRREQGFFRAFEVRGDSMDDGTKYSISHGDVAIGRRIEPDLWGQKLYNNGGTDFVIVTHDGIICKRIIGHDIEGGVITCASRNPNKTEFPNFPVRLSEVYELYKIRKVDRDWNHR